MGFGRFSIVVRLETTLRIVHGDSTNTRGPADATRLIGSRMTVLLCAKMV